MKGLAAATVKVKRSDSAEPGRLSVLNADVSNSLSAKSVWTFLFRLHSKDFGKVNRVPMEKMTLAWAFVYLASLPATASLMADDFSALYKKLNPSVVTIRTLELVGDGGRISQQQALGSGFLIDERGIVMTAAHVVHSADAIMVEFADGKTIDAEVISTSPSSDLALIRLSRSPDNPVVATLGDSDSVEIGQSAIVIGAPFGVKHSLSVGYISGRQNGSTLTGGEQLELLQTDAAINHGNSGGPLFNKQGEVIGIVSRILSESGGSDGIGFAVPVNLAKKILLDAPSFWTGFDGVLLSKELAEALNVHSGSGVLIQRVVKGSLADQAGLRGGKFKLSLLGRDIWAGGDIVLSIQGTTCDAPHDFAKIKEQLAQLRSGETITLVALRAGKTIQLTVAKGQN